MSQVPTPIELLELDIDTRIADLWQEMAEVEEWSVEAVSAFMRAAYGKGYTDALVEGATGKLCTDHGYKVPSKRR